MRVLVYVPSDSPREADVVEAFDTDLPDEKFALEYATDTDDFLGLIKTYSFDVVLAYADGALKNPVSFLRNIDLANLQGPIVCLYHGLDAQGIFQALSYGCVSVSEMRDDTVPGTVAALVNNAYYGYGGRSRIKTYGPLTIDFANRVVSVNGVPVNFTGQEFDVLSHIFGRPGKLATKESIHASMYRLDEETEIKIVDVYIHHLRKKLREAAPSLALDQCIETVWGQGYKFVPPGEAAAHTLVFGPLAVDFSGMEVRIDGDPVDLTIGEFMVLKTLAEHFPKHLDPAILVAEASKFGREADESSIARYVALLNKKLATRGEMYERLIVCGPDGKYLLNLSQVAPKIAASLEMDVETLGPIRVNRTLDEVTFKGVAVDLTERETDILLALMALRSGLSTLEAIAEKVYGDASKAATMMPSFQKLRSKLTVANDGIDPVVTRRGLGYILDVQDGRARKKSTIDTDLLRVGGWILNTPRAEIGFRAEGRVWPLPLARQQYLLMKAILEAYPNALTRAQALMAIHGSEDLDKVAALGTLFSTLKTKLENGYAGISAGLRKVGGSLYRLDLPADDITPEILEECSITEIGAWGINHTLNALFFDGSPVTLNDTEFFVVEALAETYPEVVSSEALADMFFNGSRPALNACLTNLRRRMREENNITEPLLRTIRGVGYSITANREELSGHIVEAFNKQAAGEIEINFSLHELCCGEAVVTLGASELFALEALSRADAPLRFADIAASSEGRYSESAIQAALAASLPAKMEKAGIEDFALIENVFGLGYILVGRREHIRANSQFLEVKNMRLSQSLFELSVDGTTVSLTQSEYYMLRTMFEHPRVPLSAENMQALMLEGEEVFSVTTLITGKHRIHRKLADAGIKNPDIISVKDGVGYYLTCMEGDLNVSRLDGVRATTPSDTIIRVGAGLVLNTIGESVMLRDRALGKIEGKVFDLLALFARMHLEPVTPEDIARHMFADKPLNTALASVQLGINNLRWALEQNEAGLGSALIREYRAGRKQTDPVVAYTLVLDPDEYTFVGELLQESGMVAANGAGMALRV
ncbi:MAG: winged helix-turn-helix domain-containing protein [Rhodospirillales bacterium]|nr:winged helix-turn-helix domain-containing protein [Alphaproteobacteria bacterium]MCB9986728.1 winged helix-turn-helix domain-containing protein [Rhodospirillales bacterium]USO08503.1 MAG: winged helix-turn-helix domain-containing protein [Rhodospirillales bacterium]